MKRTAFLLLFVVSSLAALADHIKGGWIYYRYLGPGAAGNNRYEITVKVYRDCHNTDPNSPQNDPSINIVAYNGATNAFVRNIAAPRIDFYFLQKGSFDPCMQNPPEVCYIILQYQAIVELPSIAEGYVLSFQRCCRVGGIENLQAPSNQWGNTYSTIIPGTINGTNFSQNNTPIFAERDTAIVCFNAPFTLDYSATDGDGDVLVYSLCPAFHGASTGAPSANFPPPYSSVGYQFPYSATNPFNTSISIDPQTGIISGVAPPSFGEYVVSVCVNEFRNGIQIGTTRKEIHIEVGNCNLSAAQLDPEYINCDSFTVKFQNKITNPTITSYLWDFGDPSTGTDISTQEAPTYIYPDTGIYTVKLKVFTAAGCQDSATQKVSVFPGFFPGFTINGSCFLNPYAFNDTTKTNFGVVNKWNWNFGDPTTGADVSIVKSPSYQYPTPGQYTATLTVGSNKGCSATVSKVLDVRDKPIISLAFNDTLICNGDILQLAASANSGSFSWTPVSDIQDENTPTPLVFPKDTTTYTVTVNDNGCTNTASVKVNVLDFITVNTGNDTTICLTDTMRITTTSHALGYQWDPVNNLDNPTAKSPLANPSALTEYHVLANLGGCQARDTIIINVVPYPQANAGIDTLICFDGTATLNGSIVGSSFQWAPLGTLTNANTLQPLARPQITIAYTLSAFDVLGCPKPFIDTVIVIVQPKINAFAGADTNIVAGQPLQLNATGGTNYQWTPATGLTATNIANPIANLSTSIDSITYIVTVGTNGCEAQDDIKITVFKTLPDIFIPTAFTPNKDGLNDVLKAIPVGIKKFEFFRVYSRWGQLLFSTTDFTKGWDGRFKGIDQPSGTYVFAAQGEDYLGKKLTKKGTVIIIR